MDGQWDYAPEMQVTQTEGSIRSSKLESAGSHPKLNFHPRSQVLPLFPQTRETLVSVTLNFPVKTEDLLRISFEVYSSSIDHKRLAEEVPLPLPGRDP